MSSLMEASRDGNLEAVVSLLKLSENENIDMRDMVFVLILTKNKLKNFLKQINLLLTLYSTA